jgi:hypothetical protein
MADQNRPDDEQHEDEFVSHDHPNASSDTGDPGRTPGTAEGDRATVEENLGEKSAGAG